MGEKIIVGPINRGLRNDRTPFVIDDDSFPVLMNAYQWRGRAKRKRGTSLLNRLMRFFNSISASYNPTVPIVPITLGGGGTGNLLTGFTNLLTKSPNASLVPGSISIVDSTGPQTYTDNSAGILTGSLGGSGTVNYSTGAFVITGGAGHTVTATFNYYTTLPVMGLEDLVIPTSAYPGNLAFDTTFSYNILPASPYNIYDVSFYKNPVSATYTNYVAKTTWTPTTWNGQNYQQFWTVNYAGALWATNGTTVPFTVTNIGMQFKPILTVTVLTGTTATLQITAHGLVVGDFVFVNEVVTTTGINFQTGYVTTVTDANNVIVTFPSAALATNGTGGIAQYLTNRSDITKDCLRWYDGDPTNGNSSAPTPSTSNGWVNFAPPLSQADYPVSNNTPDQYYLVGARIIVPFKDRLLFFGPVIQTSTGTPIYLQDTVIYSQDGTPFYTASFTGSPVDSTIRFDAILTPTNQGASPASYFEDQSGFGGFITAGIDQPITSVSVNEDVLIVGFQGLQTRLVFTGNDITPFNFFIINTEFGTSSTFSTVNMGDGVITRGSRGYVITTQVNSQRVDITIPDEVFQVSLLNNGAERFTAQRDFLNEWVYFTYRNNQKDSTVYTFPTNTLQYNYRDESWAIFTECYTSYGLIRKQTGYTWATIGTVYPTWSAWNDPWNAGTSTLLQPQVIAGNQQGFVLEKDNGTGEGNSLSIQNVSGTTITCPNHCLNAGDYIVISGCLGTSNINGNIYSVTSVTQNTFALLGPAPAPSGTYLGGGLIKRMYVPFIQTKQFPVAWGMGRKTRLGPQQYLFSTTANGQVTLLIYLSQNADTPYNEGNIVPATNSVNNSLMYSTVLYTCPESTNLGLTPANINLQMVTAESQAQTWHRMNTSLIGDTVQVGITLSDSQMRDTSFSNQFVEIELHSFILDVNPSQLLS